MRMSSYLAPAPEGKLKVPIRLACHHHYRYPIKECSMIRVALLAIATALVPFAAVQAQESAPAIPDYGRIVPIEGLAEMPDSSLRYRVVFSIRSEEHTSELQSLMRISYPVFCLKKK